MKKLDNCVRPQVAKGIQKVSQNPVSIYQGGYGKPLLGKLFELLYSPAEKRTAFLCI